VLSVWQGQRLLGDGSSVWEVVVRAGLSRTAPGDANMVNCSPRLVRTEVGRCVQCRRERGSARAFLPPNPPATHLRDLIHGSLHKAVDLPTVRTNTKNCRTRKNPTCPPVSTMAEIPMGAFTVSPLFLLQGVQILFVGTSWTTRCSLPYGACECGSPPVRRDCPL